MKTQLFHSFIFNVKMHISYIKILLENDRSHCGSFQRSARIAWRIAFAAICKSRSIQIKIVSFFLVKKETKEYSLIFIFIVTV